MLITKKENAALARPLLRNEMSTTPSFASKDSLWSMTLGTEEADARGEKASELHPHTRIRDRGSLIADLSWFVFCE